MQKKIEDFSNTLKTHKTIKLNEKTLVTPCWSTGVKSSHEANRGQTIKVPAQNPHIKGKSSPAATTVNFF